MTTNVVDINAYRLQNLLGRQIPPLTRTVIKKETCTTCEGMGLLRFCKGTVYPVSFDEARRRMFPVYVCQPCAGAGAIWREVEAQGEAGL